MKNKISKYLSVLFVIISLLLGSTGVMAYYYYWGGRGWHGQPGYGYVWHRGGRSVIYYAPPYYHPPTRYPYSHYYYPYYAPVHVYPSYSDYNTCPLVPGHYDAAGNWIAPRRVCPNVPYEAYY